MTGVADVTNVAEVSAGVDEHVLLDALDRAEQAAPAAASTARRELAESLAATRGSALGSLAWSASCLTPARFPVELAVTSASSELRTTVEVIAPEGDRTAALRRVVELAEQFGSVGLGAGRFAALDQHQRSFAPRFGAWLSSRHSSAPGDGSSTRHKAYVEVAADAADAWGLIDRLVPAARRVIGGFGPVRFLGVPLDGTGGVEVYARPRSLDPILLTAVLGRAGLGDRAEALITAMSGRNGRPFDGPNHGISVSIDDGGAVVAVAGFTFAHHRWGRDHRVRERVLALAGAEGWPSRELYARLSDPLDAPTPLARPYHVALSDVVAAGRDTVEHHVSLSPVAARRAVHQSNHVARLHSVGRRPGPPNRRTGVTS